MSGLLSGYLSRRRAEKTVPYLKGRLLDIGCGEARNYGLVLQKGLPVSSYTGIEFRSEQVEKLRKQYPEAVFHQADLDTETLPVSGTFDTIVLLAVVEHVFNLKFLFSQLVSLLSDGGVIVLTTPTPFGNDTVHRLGASLGLFSKEGGQDDHIVIFNRKRLEVLAREFGLKLTRYEKFQFGCNQLAVLTKMAGK